MNSLVSSEPNATSQNNINAALLATYDYIDSYKKDTCPQSFSEVSYNGKVTTLHCQPPKEIIPIVGRIGVDYVKVGTLKSNGELDLSFTNVTNVSGTNSSVISSTDVRRSCCNCRPESHTETVCSTPFTNSCTVNGAEYTFSGCCCLQRYTIVNKWCYEASEYRWDGCIVLAEVCNYTRQADYTNANICISQPYITK